MKAIALFSGGLDSTLAMKLIIDQGIEVIAVNINTGFGGTKDRRAHMQNMCNQVGAELMIVDIQHEYLQEVLFDAKHGYGKNFNPCIDCHGYMFKVAKKVMEKEGASFLISGEVVGQRPMSQNSDALNTVLNIGDVDGLLIRPMCAKHLKPTIAEESGWVDREKLQNISGRSRKVQMELAEQYGLVDFESPGGGCLLTDEGFSVKIRDFIKYDKFEVPDIAVLKYGRHFRLPDGAKLVVGRNQEENEKLEAVENEKFTLIKPHGMPGPSSLLSFKVSSEDKTLATQIIVTYSKIDSNNEYSVEIADEIFSAPPLDSRKIAQEYSIF